MTRWAVCVQYDGTVFSGWQRQDDRRSVQQEVETALSAIAGAPVVVACAGRTDAGVHAFGQVVSFDTATSRAPQAWVAGGNSRLPPDVSFAWAQAVPESFHARFSALSRSYRYVIWNAPARAALVARHAVWVRYPLNAQRMHAAAQALLGEQDFSAFRAAGCQSRTPMRCVFSADVWRSGAFVVVEIRANAFVYHMVRNIVGSLIEVGQGRRPPAWIAELLAGRDRRLAAATAPPGGLFFAGVEYAADYALPAPPKAWFPGFPEGAAT
ncbi:MAG: tRNA pseudouridine(38-40) synthase TruA [Nevskiaceae bacterium]|nr:MAG: tRNA pseudouridine(38-40) synthase TruA [Nevskiaceae bacterium]TBR73872.1 MAG: tRNA pseudouridine(38-40) synthase TruA [Nevskiaceae bacterium]